MDRLPLHLCALVLTFAGCSTPEYMSDPDVAICNQGGPLNSRQLVVAMEPRPQATPGLPAGCEMGPAGIMRMVPPTVR